MSKFFSSKPELEAKRVVSSPFDKTLINSERVM